MALNKHKKCITEELKELLEVIIKLPLHLNNKLLIYQHYTLPKVSCHLTIAEPNITWVN